MLEEEAATSIARREGHGRVRLEAEEVLRQRLAGELAQGRRRVAAGVATPGRSGDA